VILAHALKGQAAAGGAFGASELKQALEVAASQ
jgi:hypothetical protein